jgi:AraC-like DNA-binding protein
MSTLPLKTANALTASQLLRLCQSLLQANQSKTEDDLVIKVQAVIKAKVNVWPTMVTVAKVLGLSERTLRRRLEALGTDYQQQVDLVRQQLAKQLIVNRHVSVEQVAAVLGYSEAASLRRAFHRWWGMSPQLFRQQAIIGR